MSQCIFVVYQYEIGWLLLDLKNPNSVVPSLLLLGSFQKINCALAWSSLLFTVKFQRVLKKKTKKFNF